MTNIKFAEKIHAGVILPESPNQISDLLQEHIDLVAGSHCPPHQSGNPHISICTPGGHDSRTGQKKAMEVFGD